MARVAALLLASIASLSDGREPQPDIPGHMSDRNEVVPLTSYEGVGDIDKLAEQVRDYYHWRCRNHKDGWERSRDWFQWGLALAGYKAHGSLDHNLLVVLRGVMRGCYFDPYQNLVKMGTANKLYIFNHHGERDAGFIGGGSHGGWMLSGMLRCYVELVENDMLSTGEQALMAKLVAQSIEERFLDFSKLERGFNNRPYGNAAALAWAAKVFPDAPGMGRIRTYLDSQWREFTEYGDTTEVNINYPALHIFGMLEFADAAGKFETDRELIHAFAKRNVRQRFGSGLFSGPNTAVHKGPRMTPIEVEANPWQHAAFDNMLVAAFSHLAAEYRDPEFLWFAEQALLGGRGPEGMKLPSEYMRAYDDRFAALIDMGLKPMAPAGGAAIDVLSPTVHKVPDRIYVSTGRAGTRPYASYYVYDRNNEYMHCFSDMHGRLYEYVADGCQYLGSCSKYNGIGTGQGSYDHFLVLHPDESFPYNPQPEDSREWHWGSGYMLSAAGVWNIASGPLPQITHSRTAPDSKNWRYTGGDDTWVWQRTDDPVGRSAGNMDGLWYLNDDYHLKSATIVLNGDPAEGAKPETVFLQNLRIAGPSGQIILDAFDAIPENMRLTRQTFEPDEKRRDEATFGEETELTGKEQSAILQVEAGKGGSKCLKVTVEPRTLLKIRVDGFDHEFNVNDDYTRLSFDYRAEPNDPKRLRDGWRYGQANFPYLVRDPVLNDRTVLNAHHWQGGILERDSLVAENSGEDSFGQMKYRNVYCARGEWTRQTVLTKEGYLVVRDEYLPGQDVDGYNGGVVWVLKQDTEERIERRTDDGSIIKNGDGSPRYKTYKLPSSHDGKANWFDAPSFAHAWWVDNPKRVTLYIHPLEGAAYRQLTNSFLNGSITSTARVKLVAGHKVTFLSVLVPHDAGEKPSKVVERIVTSVDKDGCATARIGNVSVNIDPSGSWRVKR